MRQSKSSRGGGKSPTTSTMLPRRSLLLGAGTTLAATGLYLSQSFTRPSSHIQLSDYVLTFSEEFNGPDISIPNLMTRWYNHTPWNGDFGDAGFAEPGPSFPFVIADGCLRIEAHKDPETGKWMSGLLATVNPQGVGFAQQYGYFEIRTKLPSGNGVWPQFWLDAMVPPGSQNASLEVDVFEYLGRFPNVYRSTIHVWPKSGVGARGVDTPVEVIPNSLSDDFHIFGVSVEPDWIIMYLDGIETWKTPTPVEHKDKLMIIVDLALGGGWSSDETPNPSYMYVDYIRAYQKRSV